MLTEEGQIVHIDFGFIFDIVPGGVKFERSPFKLTKEMVDILGGSREAANYRRFVELCARGFLVCRYDAVLFSSFPLNGATSFAPSRPYAEQIISMVKLMLDSGLPCFKAETTIRLLRQRFMLDLSEQAAADYMVALVHSAHRALSTTVYDAFQKATNGIPF